MSAAPSLSPVESVTRPKGASGCVVPGVMLHAALQPYMYARGAWENGWASRLIHTRAREKSPKAHGFGPLSSPPHAHSAKAARVLDNMNSHTQTTQSGRTHIRNMHWGPHLYEAMSEGMRQP
jgi:hypothetical protein